MATDPGHRCAGVAGWVAALAAPAVGVLRLIGHRPTVVDYGDNALITLAVRHTVSRHPQLLGAYSRFGWHHPGPAMFYVLEVLYRLLGSRPWSVYAAALVVNAGAGAGVVAVVRSRRGAVAGAAAGAVVGALLWSWGPYLGQDPWNPYLTVVPMLLLVVCCADGATGRPWRLMAAVAVGSWEIQTHVGTAGVVGVLLLAAGVTAVVTRTAAPAHGSRRRWRAGGAALIVVMWIPPLWQQVRERNGNLTQIWHFLTAPHPTHGATEVLRLVSAALAAPLRRYDSLFASRLSTVDWPALVVFVVLGAGAVVLARRRRDPFAGWMAGASLLGAVVAAVSLTRTVGNLERHLAAWVSVLPLAVILAGALVLVGRRPGARTPAVVVSLLALVAATAGVVRTTRSSTIWPPFTSPDVHAAWGAVAPALHPHDGPVLLSVASPTRLAVAAGLALLLDEHGYRLEVQPGDAYYFGGRFTAFGVPPVELVVYSPDDVARGDRPVAPYRQLPPAGPTVLFLRRTPGPP